MRRPPQDEFCTIGGQRSTTHRSRAKVVTRKQVLLPPHTNAIDATICIATGIMTDRSPRHRTGPEHDAGPRHATGRIADVLAVHDRLGWRWIESETCKPQQALAAIPAPVADLIERRFFGCMADLLFVLAELNGDGSRLRRGRT